MSWNPDSEWSDERLCLLASAGVVSIIIYGSLLPFDLRFSVGLNLAAWLQQVRFVPWPSVSRADLIVNAAIGVPLGFFLRGALRGARRPNPLDNARAVLVVAGLSAILGTAVEMLQVLSPLRHSSWNDMLSQVFGAVLGAVAWRRIGASVIRWLRHVANEREAVALAAYLLQVYLPIYLVVQLTPFDTHRAAALAAMYEAGRAALVPAAYSPEPTVGVLKNIVGNVLLNIPVGTLAALGWVRRGRRRAGQWQVLLGISIIAAVELAHELLWSHHARVGDLFAGTLGVMIGIAAARRLARPVAQDSNGQLHLTHRWFRVAAGAWILMLVWYCWQPFEFELTSEIVNRRLTRIAVVPFAFSYWYASYVVSPWQAVHETLVNFLSAVPLGLLLRLAWPVSPEASVRRFQGMAITVSATIVLVGIELGQMFLPTRFPDVTDALIGMAGAMGGCAIATAFAVRQQRTSGDVRAQVRAPNGYPPAILRRTGVDSR